VGTTLWTIVFFGALFVANIASIPVRIPLRKGDGITEGMMIAIGTTFPQILLIVLCTAIAVVSFENIRVNIWGHSGFWVDWTQGLWLLFPALMANQAPGFARLFKLWGSRTPINESWFGERKTWSAFYLGPLVGGLAIFLQQTLTRDYPFFSLLGRLPTMPDLLYLGMALGLGAVLGDIGKSFLKRLIGIPPGGVFLPFDQIDFVVGAWLVALPLGYPIEFRSIFAFMIVFTAVIHPIGNLMGLKIGTRNQWL
jgi:CDP-2,3-bis-(O-geranylgeranyl)-sn-glycerol synthase